MLVKLGDNNKDVKAVQEWLCYNKISVVIDSDFGPATKAGVKKFQSSKNTGNLIIPVTGVVDDTTWAFLNYPIDFLKQLPVVSLRATLAETIVNNAFRHYVVKPIEIGGQNMGPFVRFYMRGLEGDAEPWCAGSASTVVLQSYEALGIPHDKFNYQVGCSALYADAKKYGTLVKVPTPGCLFLCYTPGMESHCYHVGIVTSADISGGTIHTTEGNTNDSGSREGFEYVPRIRSLTNKHFIKLG